MNQVSRNTDLDSLQREELEQKLIAERLTYLENCEKKFIPFVKHCWPEFIDGSHHRQIAEKFEQIATGEIKRLIVNMPPRHTKSEFASYLFPAWMIGRNPKLKIIQTSHNTELATRFGRKMKNLVDDTLFQQVFDVSIATDSKASGRWETNHGGEYYAAGVGGAITGRGADLLIIDDPHTEQDALSSTAMDNVYEWYTSGPRQRLQPGGSIVVVMTRWSEKDLTGQLIKAQAKSTRGDQWDVIEFPAILPSGNPVWPEYWKAEELLKVKAAISESKWQSQYQQNPTSEETAILKREWWSKWEKPMPTMLHTIQSYDTAFSSKETADYSAITTWGVFQHEGMLGTGVLLLDALKGRWDFPELKKAAMEQYKYWDPDTVIIEQKASGAPLTQELNRLGIPISNFTPSRGNDKLTRVNSIAPIFESGKVFYPDREWAHELIEECAAFPFGEFDDYVDSTTQALMRYRAGNFVELEDDYIDNAKDYREYEYYS
jgi:predicted phage terminase large subunit-like protein